MLTITVSEASARAALEALRFAAQSGYLASGVTDALEGAITGVDVVGPFRFGLVTFRGKPRTTVERDGKALGYITHIRDAKDGRKRFRYAAFGNGTRMETTNIDLLKQRIVNYYEAMDLI